MKKRTAPAVLLCAVGVVIAGLQCGLTLRSYTISTNKLAEGEQLRLVMLSDLHSYVYGEEQQPLLRMIEQAQPDLIVLCGDIVDDKEPVYGAKLLLEKITAIAPCYYVSGNHEFWTDASDAIFDMIESYGIHVLRNTQKQVTVRDGVFINLCGVDDPAAYGNRTARSYGSTASYQQALAAFDNLPRDTFNILLAHRPEYIAEYALHPFDLALCGHAHGGQWRIPLLLNGLIAPNQGFFPKYAGGRYTSGTLTEIVGRGLYLDWKPRFFNPPEVVAVSIEGKR